MKTSEKPMRVVITGGGGFIGSHLCDRYLAEGHEVVAVDNFVTGRPENLAHIQSPRFTLLRQDVSHELSVEGSVDHVLHFASPASPVDFETMAIPILEVGSRGTHHALQLALEKGAGFLMASTSEVYGDPLVHPQHESYWGNVNCIGPRSCYDEAKRFSEALVMAYRRTHGLNSKIVRIFNTYGPRMRIDDGRIIPNFLKQAIEGEPLTVYGDGSQTRSFCYVTDLVDGVYRLMLSKEHLPVNIGNPTEFTILEFAHLLQKLTATASPIEFQPLPQDDPKQRRPDITRARALLHWEPRVTLEQGLRDTFHYFREKLAGASGKAVADKTVADKTVADKAAVGRWHSAA